MPGGHEALGSVKSCDRHDRVRRQDGATLSIVEQAVPEAVRSVRLVLAFALCLAPGTAMAHAPYEGKRVALASGSKRVEVATSYIDGIVFTDPAKVIVEVEGRVVAETDYYRDTSLVCTQTRCVVASNDSMFAILPEHVWLVTDGSLVPQSSWLFKAVGLAVHFSQHLLGYSVSTLFLLVPVLHLRRSAHKPLPTSIWSGLLRATLTLSSIGLLFLWLYVVMLVSELWVLWALSIVFGMLWVGAKARSR